MRSYFIPFYFDFTVVHPLVKGILLVNYYVKLEKEKSRKLKLEVMVVIFALYSLVNYKRGQVPTRVTNSL